jgi:hypothetical protein
MVGVPGRSKACNTCKQRKIAVSRLSSRMMVTQTANYDRPISVLSKDPNARSALSQSELAPDTSASEYLFQAMARVRKLCRALHRSLSAPQMLDGRRHLQKRGTDCHYSGQSRAHVFLWSATQNFVWPLPRMFLSDMYLVSSY